MSELETALPTAADLDELPWPAIVAFTARCARRVEPLFRRGWYDATEKHISAVRHAIDLAEAISASAEHLDMADAAKALRNASIAEDAAYAAAKAEDEDAAAAILADRTPVAATTGIAEAVYAARAAAHAAEVAVGACAGSVKGAYCPEAATAAYAAAKAAIGGGDDEWNLRVTDAIRSDYYRLAKAVAEGRVDDSTPVPPEFFGPLKFFSPKEEEQSEGVTGLPTEEELATLPGREIVAFAARCARRVEPLFLASWPDAPEEHVLAVRHAIEIAEAVAAHATRGGDAAHAAYAVGDARVAAHAAYTVGDARVAAYTATRAADAAVYAARAADAARGVAAVYAARSAAYAAAADTEAVYAIRSDYELLKTALAKGRLDDDTPVPPDFFPPLEEWQPPDDEHEEQSFDKPTVDFLLNPGSASKEEVTDLLYEISKLYRLAGGRGIQWTRTDAREPAFVEELL